MEREPNPAESQKSVAPKIRPSAPLALSYREGGFNEHKVSGDAKEARNEAVVAGFAQGSRRSDGFGAVRRDMTVAAGFQHDFEDPTVTCTNWPAIIFMQGVAITQENSLLDNTARIEGWLARFPMFDWVGGRTSVMSAVGLLPAALQGINIREMLVGASLMDMANRTTVVRNNPAALLALCWYWATDGVGSKDMVVLPYKDSLLLFSRYLQQLVMESLGKEFDLHGNRVWICSCGKRI
ncbi:glucose-6-phosphate isomerase 1, chloroplastic-like [Dendrobium catenatum]|uniref:glucose-6-phosphate isomerase 1, chloroplastic-like n=1 Tax=Dendrobium catenatum TaxID=906689 RepID=UPI0010A06C34|nr:glucose-6-phosphate isomerase 1, chloroplastic-like [Dendrobium catenatum]